MDGAKVAAKQAHAPRPPVMRGGLGPIDDTTAARRLYLDLAKRALCNILYADAPLSLRGGGVPPEFDLELRTAGEDLPSQAHTFTGLRRLDNLQDCIEQSLRDGVPGDLLEAGVSGTAALVAASAASCRRKPCRSSSRRGWHRPKVWIKFI